MLIGLLEFGLSVAVAAGMLWLFIRQQRRRRAGQVIQAELPASHHQKAGTPAGGGAVFVVLGALAGIAGIATRQPGALAPALALVGGGLIGFADDLVKLREGWVGIPARYKFPLQFLLAIPLAVLTAWSGDQALFPLHDFWFYLPVAVFALVGTANAVNLTDGMDGLAGSLSLIAIAAIVFLLPNASAGEKLVAIVLCGALVGFLAFNRHPAKVFMGDTGSLAIGFTIAVLALQQGALLLLPLLGLVFVIETLSVIIQVAYFKLSGGRRIFKMTPIHYTFHLEGWSENRIVLTACSVAVVTAAASVLLAHRLW